MKNKVWGVNVIGNQGVNADNDFVIGASDDGKDVVVKIKDTELTGAEFAVLKEIAEGGPTPGGNSNSNGFYHCTETMAEGVPEHKIAEIVDGNYEHIYFNDQMIVFNNFGDIIPQNADPDEHGMYKIDGIFSITIDGESKDAITLHYAPAGAELGDGMTLSEEAYYLTWLDSEMPIYLSIDLGMFSAGWYTEGIEKDFSYSISTGEIYEIMPSMGYDWVKQIISTDNVWTTVPATEPTVDRDTIITGEKELAKGDVVLDASGNLSTVKDFVQREIIHQHATNPFAVGDSVSMNGGDYAYFIDTNQFPGALKDLDWGNAYDYKGMPTIDLVRTDDTQYPQLLSVSAMSGGEGIPLKGRLFLIWSINNDCVLGVQFEYDEDKRYGVIFGVDDDGWATSRWQWSSLTLTNTGNGIYRALIHGENESATVTAVNGQDLWNKCITKDGKWTKDESEFIPAITYDRFASIALKKDIPTTIEYSKVAHAPIYARDSIRDDEVSIHSSEINYVISLNSQWRAKGQESYQEKGILYYADKNNEKWVPITGGGGTQLYKHSVVIVPVVQEGTPEEQTMHFVSHIGTELNTKNLLGECLRKPYYGCEILINEGGQTKWVPCVGSQNFIINMAPDGSVSGFTVDDLLDTIDSVSDTVTEL